MKHIKEFPAMLLAAAAVLLCFTGAQAAEIRPAKRIRFLNGAWHK